MKKMSIGNITSCTTLIPGKTQDERFQAKVILKLTGIVL